jgi:polyisoprenoid-binding protein YceI
MRHLRSIAAAAMLLMVAGVVSAQQPAPPAGGPPPQQQQQAPLPPNGWRIDMAHSSVKFKVRHLGISWVNGAFPNWTAELILDPAHPDQGTVTAHIQTATVTTGNDRRDSDIRSGNYLAVDSFPEMTFVSRRVEVVDPTHLRITGDLTLRGVTKPVTLDTEMSGVLSGQRGKRIAFSATTTIRRQDYGVVFNRLAEGAQVVGDQITIMIDLEAVQPLSS